MPDHFTRRGAFILSDAQTDRTMSMSLTFNTFGVVDSDAARGTAAQGHERHLRDVCDESRFTSDSGKTAAWWRTDVEGQVRTLCCQFFARPAGGQADQGAI